MQDTGSVFGRRPIGRTVCSGHCDVGSNPTGRVLLTPSPSSCRRAVLEVRRFVNQADAALQRRVRMGLADHAHGIRGDAHGPTERLILQEKGLLADVVWSRVGNPAVRFLGATSGHRPGAIGRNEAPAWFRSSRPVGEAGRFLRPAYTDQQVLAAVIVCLGLVAMLTLCVLGIALRIMESLSA
jgi:hypothetical protein